MKTKDVLFKDLHVGDRFISDGLLYIKTDVSVKYCTDNAVCQSKRVPCFVPNNTKVVRVKED